MSTKKAISTSFVAIFILIITQIIAQSIASMFVIIKIPTGICNIIAGIIYAGLTYLILKMFISKIIKLPTSDFGMPKFAIKIRWILIAVLLPFVIKGSYLLIFNGKYVSSNMNGNQMFITLSAGVAFTGIAAGFVEEMVFRGVILNALKKRWNIKVAVIVPSMLFGIVHVLGQDFSIGSCLLVIIAGTMVGVMFSMIAIESGSVWNSGIVHAIWNVVIIGGGLAIGEKMDKYSIMTYVLNSKDFAITGGEFGIESSVISLFGYIIVAGIAFFMIKSRKKLISLIRTDGTLRIPPQAMEEYHIADEGKAYLLPEVRLPVASASPGKAFLHPSKLGHILDDTPPLLDYSAGSGEFIKYKGRSYCWVEISQEGQILLTKKMMDFLKVRPGMELLSIRSSDIAFTMGAKGPLLEKAENYDGEIPLFKCNNLNL